MKSCIEHSKACIYAHILHQCLRIQELYGPMILCIVAPTIEPWKEPWKYCEESGTQLLCLLPIHVSLETINVSDYCHNRRQMACKSGLFDKSRSLESNLNKNCHLQKIPMLLILDFFFILWSTTQYIEIQ